MKQTVGILGTGDMGSAVAGCLIGKGFEVVSCLEGRSERSRRLAADAGISNATSLAGMVSRIDVLLSILPPSSAPEFAREICPLIDQSGRDILFADCNAVSPATVSDMAGTAAAHKVRFQDIGIVGAAPHPGRLPVRFYTSGPWIAEIQDLGTGLIDVKPLGEQIGRASALKMVYASLTKGTNALRVAALLAAEQLGVGEEARAEWAYSLPDVYKAMQGRVPDLAADAGRWTGEMREIAATFESAGVTPFFHEGAEWVYALLAATELADESRDEARGSGRSMEETLRIFAAGLSKDECST